MVKSVRRRRALLAGAVLLAGSALWFGTDEVLIRVHSGGGITGRYDTVVIWESGVDAPPRGGAAERPIVVDAAGWHAELGPV